MSIAPAAWAAELLLARRRLQRGHGGGSPRWLADPRARRAGVDRRRWAIRASVQFRRRSTTARSSPAHDMVFTFDRKGGLAEYHQGGETSDHPGGFFPCSGPRVGQRPARGWPSAGPDRGRHPSGAARVVRPRRSVQAANNWFWSNVVPSGSMWDCRARAASRPLAELLPEQDPAAPGDRAELFLEHARPGALRLHRRGPGRRANPRETLTGPRAGGPASCGGGTAFAAQRRKA